MNFNENKYMPRLVDEKIEKYLKVFGAISVEDQNGVEKLGLLLNTQIVLFI